VSPSLAKKTNENKVSGRGQAGGDALQLNHITLVVDVVSIPPSSLVQQAIKDKDWAG
jgi:hypothetical protein